MPYESGGRGDKSGNRYEIRWVVYQTLEVLNERADYFILEALGDRERGVDVCIGNKDGSREYQQCKGRCGIHENWTYGTANAKRIFTNWKSHLDADVSDTVSLVSPLAFTLLEDLIGRANNSSENPKDFYEFQVLKSSIEFQNFFRNFCGAMDIDPKQGKDLIKCLNYLHRIKYRQRPDSEMKSIILDKISLLLIGDREEIYDKFVAWIVDGDILGKQINQSILKKLLKEKNIGCRDLANDERILPRFKQLNDEYEKTFAPLNGELIQRKEFPLCREYIDSGMSLIIHGNAGRGKSGCTADIINYCEEKNIPYIAIGLDKRVPSGNAEKWGIDLGLPASIAHCIHSISKNEKAVIILDQLDALRWTLAHSRDAFLVCAEIINQVKRLNSERTNDKLSIVLVCRTYDLKNDNTIKSLFKKPDNKDEIINWREVQVGELDEEIVMSLVGKRYSQLTDKLKETLRIPSNLYVWQHLIVDKEYSECFTAMHLVLEWWKQLENKCFDFRINETDLNNLKEQMVAWIEEKGRTYIPANVLSANASTLDFLTSNSFLLNQNSKVSFAHQSILDCFLAEKMFKRYYNNEEIVSTIGNKEKQTPAKKYQVQMFLERLLEIESQDFIDAGQKMFESDQIRFFVKFVFLEVLNQIDRVDENIQTFIFTHCENPKYEKHLLSNVILFKPNYIRLFRQHGIFDKWFNDPEKKEIVFNLLASISPNYDSDDIVFIMKYAFKFQSDDDKFARCFMPDISQEGDEFFEFRMKFYDKHPPKVDVIRNFDEMLKKHEIRTIRVLALLLKNKIASKESLINTHENELFYNDSDLVITKGNEVIDLLLPLVPTDKDEGLEYSDWSERYYTKKSLERACIQTIKKANAAVITEDPELFFQHYRKFMGKGFTLYNEIILDGLWHLPQTYSDMVVEYLSKDFDTNIFDRTSSNRNVLFLATRVLRKHSQFCSENVFVALEKSVLTYLHPRAKDIYKRRKENNREKDNPIVYWSFWGDLQKEILEVLPFNRLSKQARELIPVLERKFTEGTNLTNGSHVHGGYVSSPVAGKKLSNKKWLSILSSTKIKHKSESRSKKVPGGFIESNVEEFANSFRTAVSEEPTRMINLVLSHKHQILDVYVEALFSGVAYSKNLDDIPFELLEMMILSYPSDNVSRIAEYTCEIIENRNTGRWSQRVLDMLKCIAVNHVDPENTKPNITNDEDKEMRSYEMLRINAINCTRGKAANAIMQLLYKDKSLFEQFKDTIEELIEDENPAVRFATLSVLEASYYIDRDWSFERILNLCEKDYRFAGFNGSKDIFISLYPKYRKRVLDIILHCYESDDKDLIRIGAHSLSEMYILKNEFEAIMENVNIMSVEQAESVLNMAILYFNKDEYNEMVKNIILKFKRSTLYLEIPISRLFFDNLVDLERDRDFLIEIMNSSLADSAIDAFMQYLKEKSKSLIDYKDIILSLSNHLVNKGIDNSKGIWGIENEIFKLIVGLYDETSASSLPEKKDIAQKCLDIWDLMFEKQIGSTRNLSKTLMER